MRRQEEHIQPSLVGDRSQYCICHKNVFFQDFLRVNYFYFEASPFLSTKHDSHQFFVKIDFIFLCEINNDFFFGSLIVYNYTTFYSYRVSNRFSLQVEIVYVNYLYYSQSNK